MLKKATVAVLLFVLLVVGGGALLPADFAVARTIVIAAPPVAVHRMVDDLARWSEWIDWGDTGAPIAVRLGGKTAGVGAEQSWRSEMGSGHLRITRSDPRSGVEFDLTLDDRHPGHGVLTYTGDRGGTAVTWRLEGEIEGISGPYFAMFMEKLVGPMFSRSLARLKHEVEARQK